MIKTKLEIDQDTDFFREGDIISGIYMDVNFSGIVISSRQNYCNNNVFEINVKLDSVITVFSYDRTSLLLDVRY